MNVMNKDKMLTRHVFEPFPELNGGETLLITTEIYDNGDGIPDGLYFNQSIELHSYANSASINLCGGTLTPDKLRELANELDKVISQLK